MMLPRSVISRGCGSAAASTRGARSWWQSAVVYQVYLRSFYDSNGDGIGDLPGLISRLDHIERLGADTLWLSPIYASPNDDNGYDISDYRAIHPDYGTMEDFDALVRELKRRGMRLLMDQVVNHTSDEHPWFIEARSSRDNPKRNWYHWHPGRREDGRPVPPNNWKCAFDGSAWEWNELTGDFYLHLFSRKQPDLNWTHPEVRDEICSMLNWWLDKGVDGFRLDVINMLAKAPGWPDAVRQSWDQSPGPFIQLAGLSCNQPGIDDYLRELRDRVFRGRDIFTVGEMWCVDDAGTVHYTDREHGCLDSIFQFYFHYCRAGWQHMENFSRLYAATRDRAWLTVTLGNHDSRRALSKFGSPERYPFESATLLAAWLLTLPATPFLFQGEELGLTDIRFDSIAEYRDIQTINRYKVLRSQGKDDVEALEAVREESRDNARTPLPWSASAGGGFSSASPWIRIPDEHLSRSVEHSVSVRTSIFNAYRTLIRLRKAHPVLVQGDFVPLSAGEQPVLAYHRGEPGAGRLLIVLNWSDEPGLAPSAATAAADLLWTNYVDAKPAERLLRPWEARILSVD